MYRWEITRQGRITIPKALRDRLGWREGDHVVFSPANGRLTLQTLPKRSLDEMANLLLGCEAKIPFNSFEELLELEKRSARGRREQSQVE